VNDEVIEDAADCDSQEEIETHSIPRLAIVSHDVQFRWQAAA
jgi:hypothetical protein